jgi:hypothetical protein
MTIVCGACLHDECAGSRTCLRYSHEEFPVEPSRWFRLDGLMEQTEQWVDRAGRTWQISEMSSQHAENTYRLLLDRVPVREREQAQANLPPLMRALRERAGLDEPCAHCAAERVHRRLIDGAEVHLCSPCNERHNWAKHRQSQALRAARRR